MKPRKDLETIGERLRKKREALGLSLKEVADELQAPQKYIQALEENAFEMFTAKIYGLGYLRKLTTLLAVEDKSELEQEFSNEWGIRMFQKEKELWPLPQNRGTHPLITPVRLGISMGGVLLLFFLIFLGARLAHFVGTPQLSLLEPHDRVSIDTPVLRIRGSTEKEGRLTVNGRELTIDQVGNFNEEIELAAGLNVLEFIAKNRFGRETREVRYVVVK